MITHRLAGKVVLITGAASDIGAEHAILFAMHGAKVLLGDTRVDASQNIAEEIRAAGGIAACCFLDVRNELHWTKAVSAAEEKFSSLTTLVNVAGVEPAIEQQTVNHKNVAMLASVNQLGIRLGMEAAIPLLRRSVNASIVNIVSMSPPRDAPDFQERAASITSVTQQTRDVALKYAKSGLRANTLFPGVLATSATVKEPRRRQDTASSIPIGRTGFPEEIAYCSLFLCSDEASYVTGAEFHVDGGASARQSVSETVAWRTRPLDSVSTGFLSGALNRI